MKVLSVKQPWAWLICSGIKPIENRTWKLPEKMKGQRVLIHASGKMDTVNTSLRFAPIINNSVLLNNITRMVHNDELITSAIIGSVEIVDCMINHESIWAEKTPMAYLGKLTIECQKPIYNWVLANPVLFDNPILNVKGKLRFWEYPNILAKQSGINIE